MPRINVQHAVFVDVPVELPTSCPHCHAWFEDEDDNNLLVLRLALVQGRTSISLGDGNLKEVLDGYDETDRGDDSKIVGFACNRCKEPVVWTHFRTWDLNDMQPMDAARFRTLLYDSDVKDPFIKEKVFGATKHSGYQGDCEACNIEAWLGTREVPHPIDVRLHTCKL
jgi:hypothetical protein